jgi:hypothetical protein
LLNLIYVVLEIGLLLLPHLYQLHFMSLTTEVLLRFLDLLMVSYLIAFHDYGLLLIAAHIVSIIHGFITFYELLEDLLFDFELTLVWFFLILTRNINDLVVW